MCIFLHLENEPLIISANYTSLVISDKDLTFVIMFLMKKCSGRNACHQFNYNRILIQMSAYILNTIR